MSEDKFFSKKNLYPAIWTLIVGLFAFTCGLIWKSYTGPDKVVVMNRDATKDTTVTVIQFKPDQEYFDQLTKLTTKSVKQEFSKKQSNKKQSYIDSLTLSIVKEYQLKFDYLQLKLSQTPNPQINDKITSIPIEETNLGSSSLKKPKFKLPSIVEGFTETKVNSFASISLNSTEFNRKEKVSIKLDFFRNTTLEKITPIFVDIVEPKSANSVYEIWSEQYEIKNLKNIISFSADFKPGKYILSIGFYQLDELNTKYPTFYSKKYNIEIK